MTSLITVYILTAIFYTPAGSVNRAEVGDAYKTAVECMAARQVVIDVPPVGLPPLVGLACVEVQFKVNTL
jgi:hypothetical protein